MARRVALTTVHILFGGLALTAIARQLMIQIENSGSIVNFFSYFTNLSNIFAAVVLLAGAGYLSANRKPSAAFDIIRGTSVVCMVIVGVVFSVLLRDVDLGHLLPWVNAIVHYAMPVIIFTSWLWWPPQTKLTTRSIKYWMIFPFVYLAYVLIRGELINWYPYPFLTPEKVGGYGGVAVYCLGILVLFLVSSWGLLLLGNKLRANRR